MTFDAIRERSRDLGRQISQTDEYRALKRANERVADDRETVELLNKLGSLQDELAEIMRSGREPAEELAEQYDSLLSELQGRTLYQGVVAAQSNFDRLMMRVNEEIARGIEAGDQSRIILPS